MLPQHRIGERVHTARIAAHLTQEELAGSRYSKSYISALERGKMMPSLKALAYLAVRLKVSRAYLLGEESQGNEALARDAEARAEQQAQEAQHAARLLAEAEQWLQQGRYAEAIARFASLGQQNRVRCAYEAFARDLAAQGRFQEAYEAMLLAVQAEMVPGCGAEPV